jgi:hypothetical protein
LDHRKQANLSLLRSRLLDCNAARGAHTETA